MKIKDLDINKRYKLDRLSDDQILILYNWLCANDKGWEDCSLERFIKLSHTNISFQYYNVSGWSFVNPLPDDESIQTLFNTEELKFKQGNVYLFSNDGFSWEEGVFVVEWDGYFYKESVIDVHLTPFKFIKPIKKYEWYVVDRGVDKQFLQLTEDDALYYNAQEIHTQKVTNESLIKALNEYGNLEKH